MLKNQVIIFIFFSTLISFTLRGEIGHNPANRQTPEDINDDHMVIQKINPDKMNSMAYSGGNIYFDRDKSLIVPTEHIKIEEISKALKKILGRIKKVSIEGFASKDGDNKRNHNLGMERALAVKEALIKEGISTEILEVKTIGDRKPFQFENRNKNRRAQIRIYLNE